LASEAADLVRLANRIGPDGDDADLGEDELNPPFIRKTAYTRLHAIEARVSHLHARSPKGALFQLLIAYSMAADIAHELRGIDAHPGKAAQSLEAEFTVERLLLSAIAALPESTLDADAAVLREHYAPSDDDVTKAIDRLIKDAA
jgi:hypothetical protein